MKKTLIRSLLLTGLLILLAVLIGLAYYFQGSPAIQGMIVGIFTSVIASVFYRSFDLAFSEDNLPTELMEKLNLLDNNIQRLHQRLVEYETLGIKRIARRYDFDDAFWKDQIQRVSQHAADNTEVLLLGRTLSNWTHVTFFPTFPDSIIRILKAGGRVKFLAVDPSEPSIEAYSRARGKTLTEDSLSFVSGISETILPKLTQNELRRLEYRRVSVIQLTFTMFSSNQMTWFSPYLSIADAGSNIGVLLQSGSNMESILRGDFNKLWLAASAVPLQNGVRA